MKTPATLVAALLLALTAGCGPREAGPHEHERGSVFYWQVTGSDVSFGAECTDDDGFRGDIEPPEFEPNSFLMYELSDDGEEAVAMDCESTLASSCDVSDTGIVFDVSGNKLRYDPEPVLRDLSGDCDVEADELWTLVDEGETLPMTVEITFDLVGDPLACDQLESEMRAQSPNGKGFDGCVVSMEVDTAFHSTGTR